MRWRKSFVIHLYVDSEAPKILVGDLQAIPDPQVQSFKSAAGLIELLIQWAKKPPNSSPATGAKEKDNPSSDKDA